MLKVYGIPTCNTCKKALKWLDTQQIAHKFINTKESPPTSAAIAQWVQTLGNKPLRNTSGKSYRALPATKQDWSDSEWVDAFAQDPMLLKRPLFERDGVALKTGFRGSEEELLDVLKE